MGLLPRLCESVCWFMSMDPGDPEHLEMLKYLILMINGGRMRKGEEEIIKDSGRKETVLGNLGPRFCICCI